jgi:two-component system phosphate regulon sensor histidine kinase PhoR
MEQPLPQKSGSLYWSTIEAPTISPTLLVILSSTVTAALAACVALVRSRARSRRIRALVRLTGDLLGSSPSDRPLLDSGDEIAALERSISAVATEIHSVVDRLKTEIARREAILASMAEGLLAVDKNLRVVFCNEALTRAVGMRAPLNDRLTLLELVRDSNVLEIVEDVIKSGSNVKRSLKIGAAGGRSFEVYATPLATPAGRGAITIFHDITGLERMEQVRKDFIANVSHEMRTPLASIVACADTLLNGGLEDASANRRFVEIMLSNATRINNISADLLTLSDLESGGVPGQMEPVSIREALETALRAVETEAGASGIKVVRECIEDVFVPGFRFRLEQALLNLLANAIKFNRPGGEVRVTARKADGGDVKIVVADTGIGIPSQDLPRIFERFYRVDKARSRQVGGTGLGLSIARHVVEGMNGKIKAESQLGRGSTFTITLPLAQ